MLAPSDRQLEVLPLIFLGKSNDEIAQILGISSLTVKNHVQTLLRKLCVPNRMAAVYIALKKGYLQPPEVEPPPAVEPEPPLNSDPHPAPLPPQKWIQHRGIKLCWETMEATIDDNPVKLYRVLFRLLHFFVLNPHRTHTRQTLLDYVHSQDRACEERTVDVHIRHLRIALEKHGYGDLVETVRGIGYRLRSTQT